MFVAAPSYLDRTPAIAIPADLSNHPLIGFLAFGARQTFRLEARDGSSSEVEMTCRVTTTSSLAIKHWALAGAGIARYPHGVVADELRDGRLVDVLPGYINPHPPLSMVYMPERFRPANVRRLIEHALEHFRSQAERIAEA
jgi:DNA-binding transcriptional LysR family regulator